MCSTKLSLSHGSGTPFSGVWAMARDPIFWGVWAMAREHLFWGFEPWLRTPFLGGLSHGSRPINYCIWAMAQEHLFSRCWSCALHCSGKNFRFYITSLYWVRLGKSMGQRPKKGVPEPWLKPPQNGVLSHGFNPQKRCSRAMAQTPQKWGPEPWLKLQKKAFLSHGSNSTLYCTFSHGFF